MTIFYAVCDKGDAGNKEPQNLVWFLIDDPFFTEFFVVPYCWPFFHLSNFCGSLLMTLFSPFLEKNFWNFYIIFVLKFLWFLITDPFFTFFRNRFYDFFQFLTQRSLKVTNRIFLCTTCDIYMGREFNGESDANICRVTRVI